MKADAHEIFNPLRYWSDRHHLQVCIDATDAELDREDSLSDRYAFQLGREMGIMRLTPPHDQEGQPSWPHPEMAAGYAHGMQQQSRRSEIYLRKLLNLKVNAFARKIPVSSALSVEYLRSITVPVCPVSGVHLTQGTMTESDWSIDRLDNDLGYVPGNLCMVSTRVNTLKRDLDLATLHSQVLANFYSLGLDGLVLNLPCGLRGLEGMRMASLMAGPQGNARGQTNRYAPLAMAPGAWTTVEAFVATLHVECAKSRLENKSYQIRMKMFKRLGNHAWRMSNRLVELVRTELGRNTHPADIWLDGDIFAHVAELIDHCNANPPEIPGMTPKSVKQNQRTETESLRSYGRTTPISV
jgi:hypothetical protein